MRAVKRRRPRKEDRLTQSASVDLDDLSARVRYIISPEHKDYLTPAGPGKLRNDASACPRGLDFAEVEDWLKKAVLSGDVSADLENNFPRYVWARMADRVYEARLSNSGLGEYKGYPLFDHEAPEWLT